MAELQAAFGVPTVSLHCPEDEVQNFIGEIIVNLNKNLLKFHLHKY